MATTTHPVTAPPLTLDALALDPAEWADTPVETSLGPLTDDQRRFIRDGYTVAERLIPDDLIDAYAEEWLATNGPDGDGDYRPGGWPDATPYMRHPALRSLCTYGPLSDLLAHLIGEPMAVHLNLTGWVTTERDWHQDSYLNEPYVGGHYAAVWIALDEIHQDSGPFQLVKGSTAWPQVSQRKVRGALRERGLDGDGPMWPKATETLLTPLFEAELERRRPEVVTFLPGRGDVIVWNGRALHRGSRANRPGMERRALIAHYSGVGHRPDMPPAIREGGGWLFPLGGSQPVR